MKGYAMTNSDIETYEANGVRSAIENLNSGETSVYSSLTGTDFATRRAVLAAVTNSTPVADNLNKTIALQNVVVQAIEMTDEQTGELQTVPRVILIDESGAAYHAISSGIFRSLENILGILGEPSTWPEAVPISVSAEKGKQGKYFTITLA